jgi:hypothetical protein
MNAAAKSSKRSHSSDYFCYTFAHAARRLPLRSYPFLSTARAYRLFKRILPQFRGGTPQWIRQALIWGVTTAIRRKHFSGDLIQRQASSGACVMGDFFLCEIVQEIWYNG